MFFTSGGGAGTLGAWGLSSEYSAIAPGPSQARSEEAESSGNSISCLNGLTGDQSLDYQNAS